MQKETLILIAMLFVALFFLFLTFAQNVSIKNDNQLLANAFFTNQKNLVNICKIDYNALMEKQRKQYYLDLNALLYKQNYRVG